MVYIVETKFYINELVKEYIESNLNYNVLGISNDLESFTKEMPGETEIIITSIMVQYVDEMLEKIKQFNWVHPNIKVLGIAVEVEKLCLAEIIGVGFKAVISKDNLSGELDIAMRRLLNGGYYFTDKLRCKIKCCHRVCNW